MLLSRVGSSRLLGFFHLAQNQKLAKNKLKFCFRFLNDYFSKIGLKMIKLFAQGRRQRRGCGGFSF